MKRHEQFIEWARMLVVFSAVFITDYILEHLKDHNLPATLGTIILGLVAIGSLQVSEWLVLNAIERATWLKRLMFGEQWIEGVWFDEVVGHDHYALVTISFQKGEPHVHGEQFDIRGRVNTTWESTAAVLDGQTMRTIYRSPQFIGGELREISGYSTYVFQASPGRCPEFYSGSFWDIERDGRQCQIRGHRIVDVLTLSELADEKTRRTCVVRVIQEYRERCAQAEAQGA
jgi:hypothetical protein